MRNGFALRRAELEDLVRLDVTRAYRAAVVARDAIVTAETGLAAARRSFELVRRRYEEGLASQVEFLDARTAFTNAELNRVITVYRYAARYVELERAAALRDLEWRDETVPSTESNRITKQREESAMNHAMD